MGRLVTVAGMGRNGLPNEIYNVQKIYRICSIVDPKSKVWNCHRKLLAVIEQNRKFCVGKRVYNVHLVNDVIVQYTFEFTP